jgi:hypothetical protein
MNITRRFTGAELEQSRSITGAYPSGAHRKHRHMTIKSITKSIIKTTYWNPLASLRDLRSFNSSLPN